MALKVYRTGPFRMNHERHCIGEDIDRAIHWALSPADPDNPHTETTLFVQALTNKLIERGILNPVIDLPDIFRAVDGGKYEVVDE